MLARDADAQAGAALDADVAGSADPGTAVRASGQQTMPVVCTPQRGSSSPKACLATCFSSSFPSTVAGKPSFALEFPSVSLVVSQAGAVLSSLSSDLGASKPLRPTPGAKEQLVTFHTSLGCPDHAILCVMIVINKITFSSLSPSLLSC